MRTHIGWISVIFLIMLGCQTEEMPEPPADDQAEVDLPVQSVTLAEAPAPDSTTMRRFREVMAFAQEENLHERPIGEIMQAVGERFLASPYVAGSLDKPEKEILIVDLTGFDCVLFIEATLALARGIAVEDYSYDTFAQHILDQRYRDGQMDGYCSRLHYFSEWIANNEARGTVENISRDLGGEKLDTRLTFMSEHRDAYPRFATNDSLFQGIQEMEERLADLEIYYIPQDRIRSVYDQLQAGDIIATATKIKGLDVTHSGLVYANADGSKGFMHASTSGGVKVSPDLQAYVQNNTSQIGIVVARPVAVGD
ncbi:MAG TPA: N-acetylmuramoyl-L-alanine amidase-like domain-containing protein [Rhodothermales bacterium]|nr:N-acetylmuramoyl-L-alanine amidase-like domain-containing protein [Rhodothermales bacterium]